MDGFLVIISVIDVVTMQRGPAVTNNNESDAASRIFSMLRVFRLLRTLRPLRGSYTADRTIPHRSLRSFLVISRAPGLKLVVQTLLSSLRPIGHIVVICCTFFIIFGILGVQVEHQWRLHFPSVVRCLTALQRKILLLRWSSRSQDDHTSAMRAHSRPSMEESAVQLRQSRSSTASRDESSPHALCDRPCSLSSFYRRVMVGYRSCTMA